jgi:hypothetical protein
MTYGDFDKPLTPLLAQDSSARPSAQADCDADLTRVVEAWPVLPSHIRAAVLALVAACR